MTAMERLRRDHQVLRSRLDLLEAALRMGPEAWFVLREMCHALAGHVKDHLQREEALVAQCRAFTASAPLVLDRPQLEHRDEPERLRQLHQLFLREEIAPFPELAAMLRQVIDGLRRHMAEEEAELFPLLERLLEERGADALAATDMPLNEVMTVNRIIRVFPRTRPVFEELFVNVPYEGCDCLDEVAWRHGLDARQLLQRLEGVVGRDAPASSEAEAGDENELRSQQIGL